MDRRAKQFRRQLEDGAEINHIEHMGSRFYSIWIDNKRVSSKLELNIKDHVHGGAMKKKLIEKGDISAQGVTFIDWNAIGAAGKNLTAYEKLWVTKFSSGFCGTATHMHFRYISKQRQKEKDELAKLDENGNSNGNNIELNESLSQWTNDLCPLCAAERENTKHVLKCTHHDASFYRLQQFNSFSEWLTTQRSDPSFRDCVILVLQSQYSMSFTSAMKTITTSKLHLSAAAEQDEIGTNNFLLGRLSRKWREIQRSYLSHRFPNKNYSADAWVRRVITKIYRITQSFWKFRCEFVHGIENVLTSKREKKALQKEIRKQFKLGIQGVRAEHKILLHGDVNAILNSSIREQKYWVRTIRLSRAYITEAEKNMFVGMRNIMLQWAKPPD